MWFSPMARSRALTSGRSWARLATTPRESSPCVLWKPVYQPSTVQPTGQGDSKVCRVCEPVGGPLSFPNTNPASRIQYAASCGGGCCRGGGVYLRPRRPATASPCFGVPLQCQNNPQPCRNASHDVEQCTGVGLRVL